MKLKQVKEELYKLCVNHINDTINTNNKCLKQLSDAIASESKSTAGDKHETGRAMINLEQENLSKHKWNRYISRIFFCTFGFFSLYR